NPRYRWLGELPAWKARRLIARARVLCITSQMEGGANVLSEAIAAGTPVLASRIPAMRAILGRDYPGLFPYGDTRALAALLRRPDLEDLGLDAQLITRPDRARPLQLVGAGADDAAGRLEIAADEQAHGEGRRMPSARCQATEERIARSGFIEMERLRIELRGE